MVKVVIKKSTRKDKKFMAIVRMYGRKKTVHFGAKNMSDYTHHRDDERKKRYIKRHQKREKKFWCHKKENLFRPSYWSRFLLWNKKTIKESKKFIEDKQNINI